MRDIYDLGDQLLIVACDRISAYDHILTPGIPGKGRILCQLSNFWFDLLATEVPNHLLAKQVDDFPQPLERSRQILNGRSVLVQRAEVIPFECVARGYLAGSAFREYREDGTVCGLSLPDGLLRADRLPQPLFTPATKAETGHDENISFEVMAEALGASLAEELKRLTLTLYERGARHAAAKGLILADTKFEFGLVDDRVILVDEVLTPDSSRFWDQEQWEPGTEPVSFDKQYVRNWLDGCGWDHESPPPELPPEVVAGTFERYREAYRRLTEAEPDLS